MKCERGQFQTPKLSVLSSVFVSWFSVVPFSLFKTFSGLHFHISTHSYLKSPSVLQSGFFPSVFSLSFFLNKCSSVYFDVEFLSLHFFLQGNFWSNWKHWAGVVKSLHQPLKKPRLALFYPGQLCTTNILLEDVQHLFGSVENSPPINIFLIVNSSLCIQPEGWWFYAHLNQGFQPSSP